MNIFKRYRDELVAFALLALLREDPSEVIRRGDVSIGGDAELASRFQELLQLLRPDLEAGVAPLAAREDLAQLLDGVPDIDVPVVERREAEAQNGGQRSGFGVGGSGRGFAGRMYGEFGAMRFPRQHRLGQHLIHERFGLATTPFGMEDPDTLVHLNGKRVRRSEVTLDSFDFGLPEHEKGRDPKLILREAAQIHPMLGFLAILGGLLSFGPLGILVGPVILSLVLSAVRIYRMDILGRRATSGASPAVSA